MNSAITLLSQLGFVILTIVYVSLLVKKLIDGIRRTTWAEKRKNKFIFRTIAGLALWTVLVSAWSLSGVMGDFSKFPFNFMPVIIIPLLTILLITFSHGLPEILKTIPEAFIIKLQSFRFFVELLLWSLFARDLVPVQMTFEGRNFDILVGISAPIVAWLIQKKKISHTFLVIWNLAGLALLLNIVVIAIVSTPSPVRLFMNEPANVIVTEFPVSWLPGLLVPLAYTLHFFSLRQLAHNKTRANNV